MSSHSRYERPAYRRGRLIGAPVATAISWSIALGLLSAHAAQSPVPATPTVAFDVASIKENKSDVPMVNLNWQPGGRFVATNVSLQTLIGIAFSDGAPLPPNRIVVNQAWMGGGASYVSAARFDIEAKTQGDPPREQLPALLRSLLADRFKLVAHRERRELPVYFLRFDRDDRRLGPRLRISQSDCPANGAPPAGAAVPPPPSPGSFTPPACGFRSIPGRASGRAVTMATVARLMTGWLDDHRPVEDQTRLAGNYDVDLEWLPNRPLAPDAPPLPAVDPNSPPLVTAIKEQLGLKLEPGKTDEDLLVVDHAELPTPN